MGAIDTDLLDKMIEKGPSYLHAVTNYETNVIRYNRQYYFVSNPSIPEPLVFIYPSDGTFWMTNPLCIVDQASWSTSETIEAAKIFQKFALTNDQQRAMASVGVRPFNQSFNLDFSGSPFVINYGYNTFILLLICSNYIQNYIQIKIIFINLNSFCFIFFNINIINI